MGPSAIFALLLALPAVEASAMPAIYKCVQPDGSVVFAAQPCGTNAQSVDTSTALRRGTAPNLQGVSDYAALGRIERECRQQAAHIDARYHGRLAAIDRQIASLQDSMRYSNNNLAGAQRDTGIRSEIASLRTQRSDLERLRFDEQRGLTQRCEADLAAERRTQEERAARTGDPIR